MKKIYLLLCIILSLTFHKSMAQVFTSGFESWTTVAPIQPTDWFGTKTGFSIDSATQYTSAPHAGTYACKLVCRIAQAKRLTTQPLSITASTTYTITFWVKGHGSIRTGLYTGGSNNTTAYVYGSWFNINSSTWAQKTQSIVCDTTSSTAEFILSVRNTLSDLEDIQVDDVNITSGSTTTVPIHDIQYTTTSPYASPYNGLMVITGGIVSAKYNNGMFLQSGYGPWSGIYVSDSAHIAAAGIAQGDSVTIAGMVTEVQTYTELKTISNVNKVSSGNVLHPAFPVTLVNTNNEELEGVLVSISSLPCSDNTGSALGNWAVYNGTDTTHMGGLIYKYTSAIVGNHYNIKGVVYLETGPVMRVEPRASTDVEISTLSVNYDSQNAINVYPNPVRSELTIKNMTGIQSIRITNMLGAIIANVAVSGNSTVIHTDVWQPGVYFISLTDEQSKIMTGRIVKQ
jgi:hypothetical protein